MPWNPDQYHKFREQRATPFEDLVKLITMQSRVSCVCWNHSPIQNFVIFITSNWL